MYNIFNMGLGMVVAIRPDRVDEAMNLLEHAGEKAYRVGHVIEQVNERVDLYLRPNPYTVSPRK